MIRFHSIKLEQRRSTINEKIARKERKKEKKRRKLLKEGRALPPELLDVAMADAVEVLKNGEGEEAEVVVEMDTNGATNAPMAKALELEEEERLEEEEKKKRRDPPIVYKEAVDVRVEFDALVGLIDGQLNGEEQQSLEELHQYLIGDEGSWVLGDAFLNFVGRLLHDKTLPPEVRVRTLNVLSCAALKDDMILLLHQDRREHVLMNYAFDIDRVTPDEQLALALFIANMFENTSSSEWLLYISEWTFCNQQTSNIRMTTKVAVHSLLSDLPLLQERGTAIIYNLACKEVFDDVAVELTMALLQFFNSQPSEELLFRCMKAMARFVAISSQEVPQLIQMIGPDPQTFRGTSQRVDELIDHVAKRLK